MKSLLIFLLLTLTSFPTFALISNSNTHSNLGKNQNRPNVVGYFQSWSAQWASDPSKTEIANLSPSINVVILSFVKPDTKYKNGSMNLSETGLQFSYDDSNVLKQAIVLLHQRQPNTKVLAAIGGATYTNWTKIDVKAIADFVSDFGLDGIDIDYEPADPGCAKQADGFIHCRIDSEFQSIVSRLRSALPRPYIISTAAWSIGAFGEGQWSDAQPQGSFTGMALPLLHSPAASDLDLVNVMSYDASNAYSPTQALAAYNYYFSGPITMGVEVPPEAWGGHIYTLQEVSSLTQATLPAAAQHGTTPGMMIWSLQKQPNGTPSPSNPSAQMMVTAICDLYGLANCNDPIFNM